VLSLDRATLRGTWATVLLPVDEDGAIRWDRLERELDALLGSGVDGIYTGGTAGEFYALLEEEYLALNRLVAGRCAEAGVPCQIGASHMSGQLSVERIRAAVPLSPSALQVILPDWFPLAEDEVLTAVRRFAAEAAGVPIVLYNPPHAKTQLSPLELGRLAAAVPELIGVKVFGGDAAWYAEVRRHCGDLAVFSPATPWRPGSARAPTAPTPTSPA